MNPIVDKEAKSWIGRKATPLKVEINRSDIIKYAVATEQRAEKFLSGDIAPPMFLFAALRPIPSIENLGPDGVTKDSFLPDLPLKRLMAGGTKMKFHRAIRPGDVLTANRTLIDIVEKQGSSGPLIFVTYDLKVEDDAHQLVYEEQQTRILR